MQSLTVIQKAFPGKETLKEALKIINDGAGKDLTRGQLVASISVNFLPAEIRNLLLKEGAGSTENCVVGVEMR